MLHRLKPVIRYSCTYAVHMSPALNGSSALQCFKLGNVIEMCDGVMFDFPLGLPHTYVTIYKNPQFNSLMWGLLTLIPNILIVEYPLETTVLFYMLPY